MANIKSAKKRINVTLKKSIRNKMIKSRTKTYIKKLVSACGAGDKEAANAMLPVTISKIDRAATKGVIHKNTASRKKSRMYKLVNKINAS